MLTRGEARALDLDLLRDLAALNRRSRDDPARPAVTLCTGRPAPYVEVMCQAVDGHLPAVFENGCGLYEPSGYRFRPHPLIENHGGDFEAVRSRLRAEMVRPGKVFFQPGKEYSLSLFPLGEVGVPDLLPLAEAALGPLAETVDLVYSESCLNIMPRGVNKGEGLRFLCERAGYEPAEILGVGDSDVDLPFLALAGRAAAPANAFDGVKSAVDYVAPRATAEGVRDILKQYGVLP